MEEYFGVLQHGQAFVYSQTYPIRQILDKVGSGDTFMAGLIFGLENGWATQDIIEFCAKAAVQNNYNDSYYILVSRFIHPHYFA